MMLYANPSLPDESRWFRDETPSGVAGNQNGRGGMEATVLILVFVVALIITMLMVGAKGGTR